MGESVVTFVEKLMGEFVEPFVPKGMVKIMRVDNIYGEPALNIKIGARDVTITEEGVVGAGTLLIELEPKDES